MKNDGSLIEVKKNIFLSQKDPLYFKKYLTYFPDDKKANFEYGRQLFNEGQTDDALQFLHKSAHLGFLPAKRWLNEHQQKQIKIREQAQFEQRSETLKTLGKRLLVLAIVLFVLFLLLFILSNVRNGSAASDSTPESGAGSYFDQYFYFAQNNELRENQDVFASLLFLSVVSGLEYYYEAEGVYPSSLSKLTLPHPNNRMSSIPDGFSYSQDKTSFSLFYEDRSKTKQKSVSIQPTRSDLLELHFYPDSNQLVLSSGSRNPIVSFTVASGETPFDLHDSKVINRVVEPKGFGGTFGSRGLELENNVAIHGTNQPELIGQYVSMGCIRMKNEDIESLYPFIPAGTPFIVKSGVPKEEPLFKDGFPPDFIEGKAEFFKAGPLEQSEQSYVWRR